MYLNIHNKVMAMPQVVIPSEETSHLVRVDERTFGVIDRVFAMTTWGVTNHAH